MKIPRLKNRLIQITRSIFVYKNICSRTKVCRKNIGIKCNLLEIFSFQRRIKCERTRSSSWRLNPVEISSLFSTIWTGIEIVLFVQGKYTIHLSLSFASNLSLLCELSSESFCIKLKNKTNLNNETLNKKRTRHKIPTVNVRASGDGGGGVEESESDEEADNTASRSIRNIKGTLALIGIIKIILRTKISFRFRFLPLSFVLLPPFVFPNANTVTVFHFQVMPDCYAFAQATHHALCYSHSLDY